MHSFFLPIIIKYQTLDIDMDYGKFSVKMTENSSR